MASTNKQPIQLDLFTAMHFIAVDEHIEHLGDVLSPHLEKTKSMLRFGALHPDTVFGRLDSEVTLSAQYQKWSLCGIDTMATPKRLQSFRHCMKCVSCGLEGNVFLVERHQNESQAQHLNLYHVSDKGLVLITVDHVLPDSLGGRYDILNFQTMCRVCNQQKQNLMSAADIARVRANPAQYAKPWVNQTHLMAILDLLEMIRTATGVRRQRLISIYDSHRKKVKFGTEAADAEAYAANLHQSMAQVDAPRPADREPVQNVSMLKKAWNWFVSALTVGQRARAEMQPSSRRLSDMI